MATTAPSCTPLMSWMLGSSTRASKIGESPVEGLKKMYLMPAALSCATNRAPPVPCISRAAPCATAPAAAPATGARFCAIALAATALIPTVVRPDTSLRLEIPLSRYCLINSFTTSSSRLFRRRKRAAHLATICGANQHGQSVGTRPLEIRRLRARDMIVEQSLIVLRTGLFGDLLL